MTTCMTIMICLAILTVGFGIGVALAITVWTFHEIRKAQLDRRRRELLASRCRAARRQHERA